MIQSIAYHRLFVNRFLGNIGKNFISVTWHAIPGQRKNRIFYLDQGFLRQNRNPCHIKITEWIFSAKKSRPFCPIFGYGNNLVHCKNGEDRIQWDFGMVCPDWMQFLVNVSFDFRCDRPCDHFFPFSVRVFSYPTITVYRIIGYLSIGLRNYFQLLFITK